MESQQTKSDTQNGKKKGGKQITKAQMAILAMAASAMVIIMAFSCYGCSYQPITPPNEQEAQDSFSKLYSTVWELDTAGVIENLPELNNIALTTLEFGNTKDEKGYVSAMLGFENFPAMTSQLGFREDYGFFLRTNGKDLSVKVTYSQSKDGKTETVTLMGETSNIYCYYLKK
jgi:hypothetical protein